ncbi:MAG: hypothetical protein FWF75_10120 [Propionibacteriaceae bacterium]|nr:hypothetical protein [Propionibacteriaceae bacterium]
MSDVSKQDQATFDDAVAKLRATVGDDVDKFREWVDWIAEAFTRFGGDPGAAQEWHLRAQELMERDDAGRSDQPASRG